MKYDPSKYKVKTWKNFTLLHWIINPGIAVGELFGQRMAKVMLIDKTSDKPLMERTYVPCPHCGTKHDGRTWSTQNGTAYKNWFDYYCPECGGIIPCLHNAFAYVLMIITFPIWGWFKASWKEKWLKKQPERYKNISLDKVQYDKISWLKIGLMFGGFLFATFCVVELAVEQTITLQFIGLNLLAGFVGGLFFGYIMKYWMGRPGKEAKAR